MGYDGSIVVLASGISGTCFISREEGKSCLSIEYPDIATQLLYRRYHVVVDGKLQTSGRAEALKSVSAKRKRYKASKES